jgi:hypothetical protein
MGMKPRHFRATTLMGMAAGAFVIGMLVPTQSALAAHGGEFSLNSRAADPVTYDAVFPINQSCPTGGRAAEPIAGAQHATGVNSLTPSTMVLGEIVPFEFQIIVGGAAPADSSIELVATWDTVTTPAGDFGFSETYLVYCAFVDTADPSTSDPGGDASASFSSALVGTQIEGTLEIVGLDPGDVVIVEAWVVLDSKVPPTVSGNVQARMVSAQTLTPDVDTINVGAETVNLQPNANFLRAILLRKLVEAGSNPSQTFDFSGDITATLAHGEVAAPVIVVDGSYTATEDLPSGWSDPSIGCDDDDSSGTDVTATYNVELETVICTFTNAEAAAVTTTTTTVATTSTTVSATTTVPTTVSPTLPFTGQTAGLSGLALALGASGLLLLTGARRPERP